MSGEIQIGTEHGVEWKIDSTKLDPVIISVKSLTAGKEETAVYNCNYCPIFGYDVSDVAGVEKVLDNLIVKYANDGYKGKEFV